jgi:hypothetical protein
MRFKVRIDAVIDAPSQAQAVADAQKVQALLGDAGLKIMLQLKQVQLVEAKVDPKVTPA